MSNQPPDPKKPRRRWLGLPLLLLLVVLIGLGYLYIRGTWADTVPRDPTTPAQGPVSQLLTTEEGNITVRSAILLDQPREKVWAVVTDYERYGEVLPFLKDITVKQGKGAVLVSGKAAAAFRGFWEFDLVPIEKKGEKEWSATWDASPGAEVRVNRGGWTLREPKPGKTLLELRLEVEVKGYPRFFLRNFFLDRLAKVLVALRSHLDEK